MVKKGYKQTEIGVIPEDWEVKPLKVVAPLQRGFDLPYSSIKDGIYPVVFSNGICSATRFLRNSDRIIEKK